MNPKSPPSATPPSAAASPGPATVDYAPGPRPLAADEGLPAETTGGDADSARARGPTADAPPSVSGGRYEVLGELGRGGCGVVYRALERRSGRVVALKTMRRADGTSLEFFKREFRYLQGVSHPNLAQLYDLEFDGQEWHLTMELLEGVDFLTYVRPDAPAPSAECLLPTAATMDGAPMAGARPPLQVDRLRDALGQLAEGIVALHAHRRIHRDLKPGNVRVTPEGRVVVLDFGLATALDATGKHLHTDDVVMGTFPYMAPEQHQAPPVSSPASDWYSVGVMLYESLTGQRPFRGGILKLIRDKQGLDPPAPGDLCPELPADLTDLCMALLRRSPEGRPSGAEVLRRLGRAPDALALRVVAGEETPLLGRDRHLRSLEEAYTASRQRRAVLVAVSGPSGVGKSALTRHFLDQLRGRGALVLAGRCYEHESVPYKALDPVVDELGLYLRGLPHDEVALRLPRDMGPLTRVFPVLGRIDAVAEAAMRSRTETDSLELRRRAFAELRELLARVGERQPLVLYIDDLQWGDIDSAHLLADLLQPPDPPPMLVLTSYRSEDADSPCLHALAAALGHGQAIDRRDLIVAPLTDAETCELALLLLGKDASARAVEIVRESGGNPFFITELVQEVHSGGRDPAGGGEITMERLIRARVSRLPEGAQRLLEVVAVSGRPLGDTEACRAAGVGADARTLLARLESARFVRGTGSSEDSRLETYHDRIRETVVAGLRPEPLRQHHGRLARVLEESGRGDPDEVASHLEGAGELQKAGAYYGKAGDRAADALAFDHAAALYQKSLDLQQLEQAEARDLRRKLGKALSNAGRGAEAGPIYLAAAEGTEGQDELELHLHAADQFLLSGRTGEGLQVLGNLLRKVGLRLAGGKRRALFAMILERMRVLLRGLSFRERAAESIPAEELLRADACEMACHRLAMVDVAQSFLFMAKHIRLSLQVGEPSRVAMGLANEALMIATAGGHNVVRAEPIWQKALSLAERAGNPVALAKTVLYGGWVAWAMGRWKEGLLRLERAEEIAAREQVTHAMGLIKLQHAKLDCLMMLGRWREIGCSLPAWLQDTRRRRDRLGTSVLLVHTNVLCLAAGRPEDAEAVIREGWDEWPHAGNVMGTFWSLYGRAEAALYRGEGRLAWDLIRRERGQLNRATLYEVVVVLNLFMVHLQARTALAAAAAEPAGGGIFSRRARLLRSAARDARRIERRQVPWSDPLAKLIRAGIANLRGAREDAVSLLSAAEKELQAANMELYAAVARRHRGKLVGGEGQKLAASADAWMGEQTIRNPARIAAMLAPGLAD